MHDLAFASGEVCAGCPGSWTPSQIRLTGTRSRSLSAGKHVLQQRVRTRCSSSTWRSGISIFFRGIEVVKKAIDW